MGPELQMFVNHHVDAGNWSRSSARAVGKTYWVGGCLEFPLQISRNGMPRELTHLQVLLQASDKFPVHLPCFGHFQTFLLSLPESVLQDPAILVSTVQLSPELLQLITILF